jgi:hypothetical protein
VVLTSRVVWLHFVVYVSEILVLELLPYHSRFEAGKTSNFACLQALCIFASVFYLTLNFSRWNSHIENAIKTNGALRNFCSLACTHPPLCIHNYPHQLLTNCWPCRRNQAEGFDR